MNRVTLLLGAGSSQAAGFPSTSDLTDRVLSGEGIFRHSDSLYYLGDGQGLPNSDVSLEIAVVKYLHAVTESFLSSHQSRSPNYEDLYYLARQAADSLYGEMENPAIWQFVSDFKTHVQALLRSATSFEIDDYQEYVERTADYIYDVAWRCLQIKPESADHLRPIVQLCTSQSVELTLVATLCHDCHVEAALESQGITIADGFSKPESGVRYWSRHHLSEHGIPFLKLHGSINWFRFGKESGEWYDERIGLPIDGDARRTVTSDGGIQIALPPRPLMLMGTFNKISDYSSEMFLDLHHKFRIALADSQRLALCGYSFGDKGINAAIIEWFYGSPGRRFVIIHPNPDDLWRSARGAIKKHRSHWEQVGAITMIDKPLELVCDAELTGALAA